ncbi:MAG: glutamate formimidoyltransferase [Longimicrobiales bacterium]
MSARILEVVPNFSEGRDVTVIHAIVHAMREAGATILDWSADSDHHRSVITAIGPPDVVENAAVAAAAVARDRIDLRNHRGLHPRVGAMDVLPFVPLHGLTMADAVRTARQAGARIAREAGIPVFYYASASDPGGRTLSELRRGGFEARSAGWEGTGRPDEMPPGWPHRGAHPTAGVVCAGARTLLLAWNLYVRGLSLPTLKGIAAALRETGGGFSGLRAMAFELTGRNEMQISMNLENVEESEPMNVVRRIEHDVTIAGGEVIRTEIIGMVPDRLLMDAATDRLHMDASASERLLSRSLATYLAQ